MVNRGHGGEIVRVATEAIRAHTAGITAASAVRNGAAALGALLRALRPAGGAGGPSDAATARRESCSPGDLNDPRRQHSPGGGMDSQGAVVGRHSPVSTAGSSGGQQQAGGDDCAATTSQQLPAELVYWFQEAGALSTGAFLESH